MLRAIAPTLLNLTPMNWRIVTRLRLKMPISAIKKQIHRKIPTVAQNL